MNDSHKYQILVVDDHPIVRQGIIALLARQADIEVCAEADSAEEALEKLKQVSCDLVLADLTLGGMSGLELIRRINLSHTGLPVLVISMHDEKIYAERALQAGALGYVMKQEASETLIGAVRTVLRGQIYLSGQMSATLIAKATSGQPQTENLMDRLTTAEFEVFQHMASGLSTAEISDRIGRSIKTIESHRTNIRRKLGFKNSHELGHFAAQWQIESGNGRTSG